MISARRRFINNILQHILIRLNLLVEKVDSVTLDMERTVTTHYAVLIGINAYPESPMKGCVSDVQEIGAYLEKLPNPLHIQKFTASPVEDSSPSHLAESSELWPTYDNVTAALTRITSTAKPGDLVYIHYSGHGTTMEPPSKSSMSSTEDLALVLLEVTDMVETRYLRGLELAHLLMGMVEKKLTVTLVLDCCFSGSVVRKGSVVRYLCYDPRVDAKYPYNPSQSLRTEIAGQSSYRAASMRPNWLVDPDGYTILTACGPTERAQEIELDQNGQKHGALSYFLLRTFAKIGGVGGKQQHIYHHLCARFRETRNQRKYEQNPMLYGNKSLCFFGHANSESHSASIPIIKKLDGGIQLEAGRAHGICDGDRFAIHNLASAIDNFNSSPAPVICTVIHIGALSSSMEMVGTPSPHIQTGWIATPLTRFALRRYPVRLELVLPSGEWTAALRERDSLNVHDSDGCPFSFYVATDDSGYEIRNEMNQRLVHIPTAMQYEEGTARRVLDVVEHLARFKLVKYLTNTTLAELDHPFRDLFTVQLAKPSGELFYPGCLQKGWFHPACSHPECAVVVEDGDTLELVVENKAKEGGDALHVHLYSMGHSWEIENILRANHEIIPPRGVSKRTSREWRKKLKMTISSGESKGSQLHCEDTIKLFLTAKSTSFSSLELPELFMPIKKTQHVKSRRESDSSPSEDWAALNFRIRTCIKPT